jgi:hypothetical protein
LQKETARRSPSFFSARTQKQNLMRHHRRVRNQGGCGRTCILLFAYILKKIYSPLRGWVAGGAAWRIIRRERMFCRRRATQRENNKQWLEFSQYIGCGGARASARAAPNQSFTSFHPLTSTKDNSSRGNTLLLTMKNYSAHHVGQNVLARDNQSCFRLQSNLSLKFIVQV